MPSLEGLQQAAQTGAAQVGQTDNFARQAAAQQAASLFKSGDIKGALSTMAAIDPEHVQQLIGQFQQFDPSTQQGVHQGQMAGQLAAQSGYNSTPGQIAQIGADSRIAAAEAKQKAAEMGFKNTTDAQGNKLLTDKQGNVQGRYENGQLVKDAAANSIAPVHQKVINQAVDAIDKDPEFKDMNTEINGLQQVKALANGNLKNSELPMVMKFLTSSEFVKRFNEAEYSHGPTEAAAVIDKVKNSIAKGTTGKLDPAVMQNFQDIVDTMQLSTVNQYEEALHAKAGGVASKTNGKVNAQAAMEKLLPASNPIFQKHAETVSQLPQADQKMIETARQVVGGKMKASPQDFQDALKVLRLHGF